MSVVQEFYLSIDQYFANVIGDCGTLGDLVDAGKHDWERIGERLKSQEFPFQIRGNHLGTSRRYFS